MRTCSRTKETRDITTILCANFDGGKELHQTF